ncbi:GMC oxidoreductase [Desulfacinum infernum]|uniref:GMC oxidoreductase n=1 Tax=Desulfacinum infernum TaxID=35837 RepID=UPI0015B769EB|nr:GMC oxidoreductase [Desulfacinum infernum]
MTLLERGCNVELWDVGREEPPFPQDGVTFHELKDIVEDPVSYFLGECLEGIIEPNAPELLRYPPSRDFLVSRSDPLWCFLDTNFVPYVSYAKGGLANGWGANVMAFDDDDLSCWPISFADLEPAYRKASKRIPVSGPNEDDLSPYCRGVSPSQPPVKLSTADQKLMVAYARIRKQFLRRGIRLGRARLAVVTDQRFENACDYCDRCLWGCPKKAIYNPAVTTLADCRKHSGFRYLPNRFVLSLETDDNRATSIRYMDTRTGQILRETCHIVFLAAGALGTGSIFLRTLNRTRPDLGPETVGLLDTAVVKLPYVLIRNIGAAADARSFQFNRLIMGLENRVEGWPTYMHGEVLHLTSLLYHPLIERMPFGSRTSKNIFFSIKAALGVVTLFFPDRIERGNRLVLAETSEPMGKVLPAYEDISAKEHLVNRVVSRVHSALRRLGCIPRGVFRSRPGAGIHYAGTVPMGEGPKCCDSQGRSNLFSNVYIADGAAFPSLPSKSMTLSLAAHATRVAMKADL